MWAAIQNIVYFPLSFQFYNIDLKSSFQKSH